MAKLEKRVRGDFDEIKHKLHCAIMDSSPSARQRESGDWYMGNVRSAVRVYERFATMGWNRVSMTLSLLGDGNEVCITAITSGGGRGVSAWANRRDEDTFLDTISDVLNSL